MTSRRNFLIGAVATGGAAVATACSSSKSGSAAAGPGPGPGGDLAVAQLVAALENLTVAAYQSLIDAAAGAKVGPVPPALASLLGAAQSHHREHAAAWNTMLTRAGRAAVNGVDSTVKNLVVDPGLAQIKDSADVARFALGLENVAAATYLNAVQTALQSAEAVKLAITIQPVEMEHAAILNFLVGRYLVPDSFANTDGARPASDQIS